MLAHELLRPVLNGVESPQIHHQLQRLAKGALLVDELLVPRRKLIGLDHVGRVKGFWRRALDDRLGVQQNDMEETHLATNAVADAQLFEQALQDASVSLALLDGRRNAEMHVVVLSREFAVLVDGQVARVVLSFKQVDAEPAIDHQMIDLRHVAIDDEAQVMQNHVVGSVLEILVQVVRRVFLALDAFSQPHQFFAQPFLLNGSEQSGALQVLQQGQAFCLVIGCLEQHVVLRLRAVFMRYSVCGGRNRPAVPTSETVCPLSHARFSTHHVQRPPNDGDSRRWPLANAKVVCAVTSPGNLGCMATEPISRFFERLGFKLRNETLVRNTS